MNVYVYTYWAPYSSNTTQHSGQTYEMPATGIYNTGKKNEEEEEEEEGI